MAGSYRHVVNSDGEFEGVDLLDHLGDAYEALEEMYEMIQYLTDGDKTKIFEAWRDGYVTKHCSASTLNNASCERFWAE